MKQIQKLIFALSFLYFSEAQGLFQWNYFRPSKIVSNPENLLHAKVYPIGFDGVQSGKPFVAYLKKLDDGKYGIADVKEESKEISLETLSRKIDELIAFVKEFLQSMNPKFPTALTTETSNNLIPINENVQSNIFQCEGVTCPSNSTNCKVVERSDEPRHEIIVTTVYCLDDNQLVMKEETKSSANPNKGSSVSNSRTFNRNAPTELGNKLNEAFQQIQVKPGASLEEMQKNMGNIFNNGIFAKNPFLASMNMSNLFGK